MNIVRPVVAMIVALALTCGCVSTHHSSKFVPLFPSDGVPSEWTVTDWADLRNAPPAGAVWNVENGILRGSDPRGTWLISKKEYGDFVLEFEWKLGERGNSGCALRTPLFGDPAFDGLELQMVDPRYFPSDQTPMTSELSGSLYRAIAPSAQVFRPNQWNTYRITCKGSHIEVILNGTVIQNVSLDAQTLQPRRHDETEASALSERPRRGHIGFQELSRGGGQVEIRYARIKE